MLRLTANKAKFYELVAEYDDLPSVSRVKFTRSPLKACYWLKWEHDGTLCEAMLSMNGERPRLLIRKKELCGKLISRTVYAQDVDDLARRGLVENGGTADAATV